MVGESEALAIVSNRLSSIDELAQSVTERKNPVTSATRIHDEVQAIRKVVADRLRSMEAEASRER